MYVPQSDLYRSYISLNEIILFYNSIKGLFNLFLTNTTLREVHNYSHNVCNRHDNTIMHYITFKLTETKKIYNNITIVPEIDFGNIFKVQMQTGKFFVYEIKG